MLSEAFLGADVSEGVHHGDGVGADHGLGIDGEDVDVVVVLDEVGSGHDLPGFVEGDLGQQVAVSGARLRSFLVHQGLGQDHGRGGVLLLVHDVVVHRRAQDPAFVQEPGFLDLADLVGCLDHVWRSRDLVEVG